jgi:hypothetical protein
MSVIFVLAVGLHEAGSSSAHPRGVFNGVPTSQPRLGFTKWPLHLKSERVYPRLGLCTEAMGSNSPTTGKVQVVT